MATINLKPISWIGDMYNTFESLCLEVEEVICQDTVKYVEDQMQTVGVGVKKFYSDVMQDLLPPLLDTVEEENSDTVASKSEVINENKFVNIEAEQMVNSSDGAANRKNSIDYASCRSAQCNVNKPYESTSHDAVEEQWANEDIESHCAGLDLPNSDAYATKDLDQRKDCECESLTGISSPDESVTKEVVEEFTHREPLFGLVDVSSNSDSIVEVSCSGKDGARSAEQMAECYESIGVVSGSEITVPSMGNLFLHSDGTSNSNESSSVDEQVVLLDEVKLEESCVLVEISEHSFTIPLQYKQKSYKKKIRDVFIQRKWSKGKQDQKQHAVRYEEQSAQNSIPTLLMHASTKDESDWELL